MTAASPRERSRLSEAAPAGESDRPACTRDAKRVRCLFIDNNVTYLNPTRNLLLLVLGAAFDLVCFGPGYQPDEIVRAGVARFAERHAPFDLVMATEMTTLPHYLSPEYILKHSFKYHGARFEPALATLKEPFRFFIEYSGPKIFTMLETDYQNLRQEQIELIEGTGAVVLGAGAELIPEDIGPIVDEAHLNRADRLILRSRTESWNGFRRRNRRRMMSMLHHVGDDDIRRRPFERRRPAWAVPGVPYTARAQALRRLSGARIAVSGRWLPIFRIARRAGLPVYDYSWSRRWYNDAFRMVLSRVRYAYTCGSIVQMPVRKFLEIPAAGSVFAVQPTPSFEALGFAHSRNAFAVEPDALPDLHRELERDAERTSAIALAGQEAVLQRHHVGARARQIAALADRVVQGRFAGSRWCNGAIEIAGEDGGWSRLDPDGSPHSTDGSAA